MSKRENLPYLQFYPGDWKKDPGIQALGFHDRGVWFEILMLMHESTERGVLLLNGNPMPDDALARVLGLDKQILTTTLTTLTAYGVVSKRDDGALINRRMVRDEEIRCTRQKAGRSGGNPILLKQKATKLQKQDNQDPNQIADNDNDNDNDLELDLPKEKDAPKKPIEVLVFPEKLDNEPCRNAWESWLEHKKSRGERYKSVKSQGQKLKEWAEKPEEFIEAINFSMGNNWAGIYPKPETKQANGPNLSAQNYKLTPTERGIKNAQNVLKMIENSSQNNLSAEYKKLL